MFSEAQIQEIIDEVTFDEWKFILHYELPPIIWLQVEFIAPDLVTGKPELQKGRKWLLSHHMTKSEIVATCFKAVMTVVEHEVRETFKYKTKAIYGPHFDVDWLTKSPEFDIRRDPADAKPDWLADMEAAG
jgi:hypothetical protein